MKKRIITILLIFGIAGMIISGANLLYIHINEMMAIRYWEKIAEKKDEKSVMENEDILAEYRQLYEQNSDIVGWLSIDGTKIDYPVMQTKSNPEYYLRRDFDKNYSDSGTPFADYRCDIVPEQSFNVLIYGHHTSGDSMFRWLLNYSYQSWYRDHKYIRFDTIKEKGEYEVVAAFFYDVSKSRLVGVQDKSSAESYEFYNYIEFDRASGFRRYTDRIDELKLYETDAAIRMDDHLITLICCAPKEHSGIEENGRFVLIAKKVE